MGDQYGPMVITTRPTRLEELKGKTIAIPGVLTTAFLALQLAIGKDQFKPVVVEFVQIPSFVKEGKADAGLIIHEGQLTYKTLGLHRVLDLGVWWQERTGLPLTYPYWSTPPINPIGSLST